MAISTFVPTLWSARLLAHLDKNLVFGSLVNRDYEGEIKAKGDTVKINQVSDITVKDYNKGDPIDVEKVDGSPTELKIDKAKYFAFDVEDIDAVQANISLVDRAMERASYALRDTVDRHIASHYVDAGIQVGTEEAPVALTSPAKAYEALVDLSIELDKNNVPEGGRFVVVPPWFHGLMLKDDRFVAAGTSKTDTTLANGHIGAAAGFNIYKSNNIANTSNANFKIMAGNKTAISYAQQILETEALRRESHFADLVRGLLVYGSKVVQPKALACLIANNA